MKIYNTREFKDILSRNGYIYQYCRGSHFHYLKGKSEIVINKDLNPMVQRRLIKQYKLKLK